jgi:starvation-inducible DNA-binding protein
MTKTSTTAPCRELQAVLGQLFDLHLQALEAHAHFSGTRFIDMQNQLEAVVRTARAASDAVAELVRGFDRDGVRRSLTLPAPEPALRPGERCATAAVKMITHRISSVLKTIRSAHEELGIVDPSIADVLGEIAQMIDIRGLLLTAESRRIGSGIE